MKIFALMMMLVFLGGCATSPTAQRARIQTVRSQLIARADPDSLITAAVLERFATGGEWHDEAALAARATSAAPERVDLAYQQLLLCYQESSCDETPLAARLRSLDHANGITFLFALARATRANDAQGIDAALEGLSQAERIDIYWTRATSRMAAAMAGHARYDDVEAFVNIVGI